MKWKTIPRRKIKFYPGEDTDILKALFSSGFPGGHEVKLFEKAFSNNLGGGESVASCSGRQALKLILESLNLAERDEVIFPAYTLADLVKMVRDMGLRPVFADIDPSTMNIDLAAVRKKINSRTKVIIATHMFGMPCRIEEICKLAEENDIEVIEDCAHALGAEINGKKVGTFGKAALFSFSMGKQINTFGGGMIFSSDKRIIEYAREKLLQTAPKRKEILASAMTAYLERLAVLPLFSTLLLSSRKLVEFFIELYRRTKDKTRAWNKSLSPLQSLIGRKQLEAIKDDLSARKEKADLLQRLLGDVFCFQPLSQGSTPSHCYFVVKSKSVCSVEAIASRFMKEGIDVGIKGEVMDHCPRVMGEDASLYPATCAAEDHNILLPFYAALNEKDLRYIAEKANEIAHDFQK